MKPVLMLCAALLAAPMSARALVTYAFDADVSIEAMDPETNYSTALPIQNHKGKGILHFDFDGGAPVPLYEDAEETIFIGNEYVPQFGYKISWNGGTWELPFGRMGLLVKENGVHGRTGSILTPGWVRGGLGEFSFHFNYKNKGSLLENVDFTRTKLGAISNDEGGWYQTGAWLTNFRRLDGPAAPVPEPATMALSAIGLGVVALLKNRLYR